MFAHHITISDAFTLARFGATGELAAQSFPDAQQRRLDALTTRRRQLVENITAETNRLHATTDPAPRASIERHLAWLKDELKALDAQIEHRIAACPETRAKVERMRSVPGIGPVTAAVLASALPELGSMNRWQAAMLTGTAPLANDSGKHRARRYRRARVTGGYRQSTRQNRVFH